MARIRSCSRAPAGSSEFYRLESKDLDTDSDGVSDWADKVGTEHGLCIKCHESSGGTASDLDTLRSLMSLTITPARRMRWRRRRACPQRWTLKRTVGTMALTVSLDTAPVPPQARRSRHLSGSDFVVRNYRWLSPLIR